MSQALANKYPPQIKYIVGNEGCERYSYYGMRSILQIFMVNYLLMESGHATEVMHLFMGFCYLLPLLGSYLADRYWGRYKTILYLSLFYCAGHATLSIFEKYEYGLYAGLALIALGSGGIKPCVSAFVGDQFSADQKTMLNRVYNLFYFMINFGSFFSTIFTPLTLKYYGPTIAFGIPGILMFIATAIFWIGRKHYIKVPPTGPDNDSFWAILFQGLFHLFKFGTKGPVLGWLGVILLSVFVVIMSMQYGMSIGIGSLLLAIVAFIAIFNKRFWRYAEANHKSERVGEFKIALDIAKVFASISVFWALFDQHASTWILQADQMVRDTKMSLFGMTLFEGEILPSQFSAVNPILVMIMIPIFTYGLYPFINRFYEMTPIRRMGWGFVVAASGFAAVAFIQYPMDAGLDMHILWQTLPYVLMTASEVMISITGLEFAYTQAPKSMKSTIMSFWLLTVFFGNIIAGAIVKLQFFPLGTGNFFMFFAFLILAAGGLFVLGVRNYKMRDVMQA